MKTLNIALVGCWHVHGFDFAKKAAARPDCRITAVCDGRPEWAQALQCPLVESYEDLLRDPALDGVIIAAATRDHERLILQAARAGKHVFVEKALAVSDSAARAIRDAVEDSGIHFTMSDPAMKAPQMLAKQLMEAGRLGEITNVRMRVTHGNAYRGCALPAFYRRGESGGGALIDMGCKGVHVLYQLLGRPVGVCAMTHAYTDQAKAAGVDENTVAVYRFPGGAIGVVETGWYTEKYQLAMDVCGTEGCVCQRDDRVSYRLTGGDWVEVPPEELPPPMEYPLTYWIESILNDTPNEKYSVQEAVCLTEMITAAYRAAGRFEPLP